MIAAFVSRLRSAAMPPLRLVEGAAAYSRLSAPPPLAKQPAAYVVPVGDQAGPNQLANAVRQPITRSIGVIIFATDLGDARGAGAAEDLELALSATRAALLGWAVAPIEPVTLGAAGITFGGAPVQWPGGERQTEPLLLSQGALIDIIEGALVWQDTWSVTGTLRQL